MEYLDFELPIKELVLKLEKVKELGDDGQTDISKTVSDLENQINKKRKEIYENLTSWQKVQLSRHPQRPYTLDFIKSITTDTFIERLSSEGAFNLSSNLDINVSKKVEKLDENAAQFILQGALDYLTKK